MENSNTHPIENLMECTLENIKKMTDVNTIVGDAISSSDGSTIIPISKVSFGFASGGSEFSSKERGGTSDSKYPFGGGSGAGVTIKPVAFLVIKDTNVRLLPCDQDNTYDKIVDMIPQLIDMFKGYSKEKEKEEEK